MFASPQPSLNSNFDRYSAIQVADWLDAPAQKKPGRVTIGFRSVVAFFTLILVANLTSAAQSQTTYGVQPSVTYGNQPQDRYPYPANNQPYQRVAQNPYAFNASFAPQIQIPSDRQPLAPPPRQLSIPNNQAFGNQFQQPYNVPQNPPAFNVPQNYQPPQTNQPNNLVMGPNGPTNNTGEQINLPTFQDDVLPPGMVPGNTVDLDVFVPATTGSGRINVGGTYGSDNGLVGQIIIDERDFDFRRWPRNLREAFGPTAWRGAGQHFRMELVPGDDLQRYLVSLSFPYFRNTEWSLGVSGYYFDRQYDDWDENRVGGRISLGRRLNQFLSVNAALKLENIDIDNPRLATSPQLNANLGSSDLYQATFGVTYDSRVQQFLPSEGSYLGLKFTQAFGDFSYSRGDIDFQNYQLIYQRPDFTGRHTLGFKSKLGFSGSETPVFENYLAGGFSSLRGFDFRGVSPIEGGVRVGGEFQWLNSLEYSFPLTQDDMIYGNLFVDFGTIEDGIELNSENFRVAPGFGLRVNLPYAGLGGAPFAIDFAFPVATATGDDEQTVSFFFGFLR